jgi:hypothetical protein
MNFIFVIDTEAIFTYDVNCWPTGSKCIIAIAICINSLKLKVEIFKIT